MSDVIQQIGDLFERGGPVMWVLLALSVISLTLSLERAFFWIATHRPGRRRWIERVADVLRKGDSRAASDLAAGKGGVYGRVVHRLANDPPHESQGVELVEAERPAFERFHHAHAAIITAAPLLGILGTVLGIIRSFNLLGSAEGVADIAQVAGGIAEALITTAFGLIVALITLFPHMIYRAQADRCLGNVERLAAANRGKREGTK